MQVPFSFSPRVRLSPFHAAATNAGACAYTQYNNMLMPVSYGDPEAEYWRLINDVSMWDVAVERQVELRGPDAAELARVLVPRRLDTMQAGVGWYVAVCDHRGTLLNDPILLKLADDRFWLSIADSDVLNWARCVAAERGLNVDVFEPDVSPLAIQGPKADAVVGDLLGAEALELKHFRFREMQLDGIPLVVARSGWSKQGGYELYLLDGKQGSALWNRVAEAGRPYGIGPGNPNAAERIESGLLSWGGDTDDLTNPFEVRMERYVHLDADDDVIGMQALRKLHSDGIKRHQLGVQLELQQPAPGYGLCGELRVNDAVVGRLTANAWSRRLQRNIGLALVDRVVTAGDSVILVPDFHRQEVNNDVTNQDASALPAQISGSLCELPFL